MVSSDRPQESLSINPGAVARAARLSRRPRCSFLRSRLRAEPAARLAAEPAAEPRAKSRSCHPPRAKGLGGDASSADGAPTSSLGLRWGRGR